MAAVAALCPSSALACAACFAKSDSALARGMNMGIFSLLGVIVTVLLGVAGFFIYLARRSAKATTNCPRGATKLRLSPSRRASS